MKRKLTEITLETHIIASPWFVGPTTPTPQPSHFEPPNRASSEEIESIYPSTAPPAGEER
jgi:hypothetical protein